MARYHGYTMPCGAAMDWAPDPAPVFNDRKRRSEPRVERPRLGRTCTCGAGDWDGIHVPACPASAEDD